LFLWLDPLAIASGAFNLGAAGSVPGVVWSVAGLGAVLIVSALWPAIWCTHLCPLGGMQDILALPLRALRVRTVAVERSAPAGDRQLGLPRRVVVGGLMGVAWGVVRRAAGEPPSTPVRPPGAMPETRFVSLCIRCGNCVRACPTRIIAPEGGRHDPLGLLTPALRFDRDYCREDCSRCTEVCPTGALVALAPRDKLTVPLGFPRIDMDRCLLGDDRECSACRSSCPYGAITYVFSEVDYTLAPRVDPAKCPGCGACELACPTSPVKAIAILPAHPRDRTIRS
jgi:ferredoxin-type protein NapF